MARLTAGVLLSHPETGEPVFLAEGSDAPEWAAGLLGAHVLDEAPADPEKESDEAPAGNASLEEWHAYALAQGKSEDDLKDLKRDEIRALFA